MIYCSALHNIQFVMPEGQRKGEREDKDGGSSTGCTPPGAPSPGKGPRGRGVDCTSDIERGSEMQRREREIQVQSLSLFDFLSLDDLHFVRSFLRLVESLMIHDSKSSSSSVSS